MVDQNPAVETFIHFFTLLPSPFCFHFFCSASTWGPPYLLLEAFACSCRQHLSRFYLLLPLAKSSISSASLKGCIGAATGGSTKRDQSEEKWQVWLPPRPLSGRHWKIPSDRTHLLASEHVPASSEYRSEPIFDTTPLLLLLIPGSCHRHCLHSAFTR